MNKDKNIKGKKVDKDRLHIDGTLDDVLKVSVPNPKEGKKDKKDD